MKARLIKDENQQMVLLCNDGTIAAVNDLILYDLLTDFRREDDYFSGKLGRWDAMYPDMSLYPGETIALIADNHSLVLHDFTPFLTLLNVKTKMRGYISCPEFAKKHNKSPEIVKVYCRNGRIPGAVKVSRNWLIPENAEYPVEQTRQRVGTRGPRPHMRKNAKSKG